MSKFFRAGRYSKDLAEIALKDLCKLAWSLEDDLVSIGRLLQFRNQMFGCCVLSARLFSCHDLVQLEQVTAWGEQLKIDHGG